MTEIAARPTHRSAIVAAVGPTLTLEASSPSFVFFFIWYLEVHLGRLPAPYFVAEMSFAVPAALWRGGLHKALFFRASTLAKFKWDPSQLESVLVNAINGAAGPEIPSNLNVDLMAICRSREQRSQGL